MSRASVFFLNNYASGLVKQSNIYEADEEPGTVADLTKAMIGSAKPGVAAELQSGEEIGSGEEIPPVDTNAEQVGVAVYDKTMSYPDFFKSLCIVPEQDSVTGFFASIFVQGEGMSFAQEDVNVEFEKDSVKADAIRGFRWIMQSVSGMSGIRRKDGSIELHGRGWKIKLTRKR